MNESGKDSGAPAAGSLCDVCGRERWHGYNPDGTRYCDTSGADGRELTCYRLGYEREKARAEAAEKTLGEMAGHEVSCAEAIFGSALAKAHALLADIRKMIEEDTTFPSAVLRVEIDRLIGTAPLAAPPALAVPLLREAKDQGAAAQAERLRDELRREQDRSRGYKTSRDNLSVRHGEVCRAVRRLVYHGRCVECGANLPRTAHQPACRVEEALAAVNASDQPAAGAPEAVSSPASPSAPPAASSASTSATLREIDKILGDYCGFTHLGCGPRDVYLERERRALEVLRSAESARDARTRNDVLRDLRDWLESWGDGRSIANVVLAGVATEAPAPPLDAKELKTQRNQEAGAGPRAPDRGGK